MTRRVTIDGFALRFPRAGIVNHVFNVVTQLKKQPGFDITVLLEDLNFSDDEIARFVRSSVATRLVERIEDEAWERKDPGLAVRLPRPVEVARAVAPGDIYVATDWYHYPAPQARSNVLMYYDLTARLFKQFHEHTNIVKESRKADAARGFDRIVAISDATRNDLVQHLGIPAERIVTNHLGADPVYETNVRKAREDFLPRYGIDPSWRYVLSVGTIEPRKNVIGMLEAFRIFQDKPAFRDVRLVLSGNQGWRNETLQNYLASYPCRDRIVFAGYVALEDMPSLYANAEAFLFLSHYEGFGLPILEAMKSSCPVVCSNVSSMPEVIGDCGEQVSPTSPEQAAAALTRIVDDPVHADSLRFAAYSRSRDFTWRRHAERLVDLLEQA